MEFATVKHQGRNLKMMGESTPAWRPKTRPRNKLSLNMKKLLNPRLNTKEVTVLDDDSADEKLRTFELVGQSVICYLFYRNTLVS